MVDSHRKQILKLVAEGILTAKEADRLLEVVSPHKRQPLLAISINSSQQNDPLFQFNIPADKIYLMEQMLNDVKSTDTFMKFHIGSFFLDIGNLNWERIFELANRKEKGAIYYMETNGFANDMISLSIEVK